VVLPTQDVIDFGLNPALLRARGGCSWLQHFGEGLETRLDGRCVETGHLRTSAGGGGSRRWASPRPAGKISQNGPQ